MLRLQHIALQTNDLERTRAFYRSVLCLEEANYDAEVGRLWLSLKNGFTLIFDRSNETLSGSAVKYLGLELPTYAAVDHMYKKVSPRFSVTKDMRERYRYERGPYGFFVKDPNGYLIKVFKYHYAKLEV